MKIVIVESPNKCKKIQSYLGSGWIVKASAGHIRDLPKNEMGVEAPRYKPEYLVSDRAKKNVSELKKLCKVAEVTYLATDLDREGEAIAWHLEDELKLKNYHRITFQEITEKSVKAAVANPRKLDMDLVAAQEARRIVDRLVGYSVSGVATKLCSLKSPKSAGRVQSPTLRVVVDREREIKDFKVDLHYGISAFFNNDGEEWKAKWKFETLLDKESPYWTDKEAIKQFKKTLDNEKRFLKKRLLQFM